MLILDAWWDQKGEPDRRLAWILIYHIPTLFVNFMLVILELMLSSTPVYGINFWEDSFIATIPVYELFQLCVILLLYNSA